MSYIKGLLEIVLAKPPRYCFVISKLEIIYQQELMKAFITYTPVGCFRPFKNFASDLNDNLICRKFKPEHAKIIIGLDVFEQTLDLKNKKQVLIYLNYVKSCQELLV